MLAGVDGAALRPFLSHLSALLMLSLLPVGFQGYTTVVGRDKDRTTRATGAFKVRENPSLSL